MDRTGLYNSTDLPASAGATKALCVLLALVGAACLPLAGAKAGLAVSGAAIFLYCTLALPITDSVLAYFGYLLIDGAVKILSNYHPVVHVAQDLFLLTIAARVIVQPETGIGSWKNTPFFPLFALFATSVFLQYLNPFGLGFWPSVAGTKVYLAGILLFFVIFHTHRPVHVRRLCTWLVLLGCAETALACVEYIWFPERIFALHPKYSALAADRFVGPLYRPFGTTSAPGAPSMWTYLCAPFAYYLLLASRARRDQLLAGVFLLLCLPTLVFCQTRAAMVLFALVGALALLAPNGHFLRRLLLVLLGVGLIGVFFSAGGFSRLAPGAAEKAALLDDARSEAVNKRMLTLLDSSTYQEARGGSWFMMKELGSRMPFGIGLSRVGAASAVWKNQIEQDHYFGKEWSFADNVYRAIFTELGIFGLFSWLLLCGMLVAAILLASFRTRLPRRRALLWICGVTSVITLAGGLGSEGVLYMPVGAFFWGSLALGMREASYV